MKGNNTGRDETSDSETTEYPGIDDLVETYDIPSEETSDQRPLRLKPLRGPKFL
jgi:hypothetical protein